MNTKQSNLERAKAEIFSDIAGCLNNTNSNQWESVIRRAETIIDIASQLRDIESGKNKIELHNDDYEIPGVNVF